MGSSPRPIGVKGEKEYRGQGVSYCATCDAKFYEGKDVIVIGGGNSAVEESLFITKFARKVTIVHQFAQLQANKVAQEKAFANPKISFLFEHEPREFIKEGTTVRHVVVEDLKTRERTTLDCDGVFIFAGMKPNIEEVADKFTLDQWGYIKTDAAMHTNIKDIFAIGDVAGERLPDPGGRIVSTRAHAVRPGHQRRQRAVEYPRHAAGARPGATTPRRAVACDS